MKASEIRDYTEKTWFLGTDILPKKDIELMDSGVHTCFTRGEGAIYYIGTGTHCPPFRTSGYSNTFLNTISGYSNTFLNIVSEAKRRKYIWLFFDCDIITGKKGE